MTTTLSLPSLVVLNRNDVRLHLTFERCIPLMRDAAAALSRGDVQLLLRSVLPLGKDHKFGIMPGALVKEGFFGAKLVSIFPQNASHGLQ